MSIQPADIQVHVTRILRDEAGLLMELETILSAETAVLRGNDADAIQQVGAKRQHCVESLTQLEAERAEIARLLSFGTGAGSFERVLDWCGGTTLRQRWQTNLDVARRCRQLNDCNGAIVTAQLGRVQKLLATMRGAAPPPVYNARGSRYGAVGNREFGSV